MLERSRFSDWIQFEAKLSTAPRHFFTGIFTGWIFGILSPLASPPPLPHPPPDDAKKSSDWPSSTNAPFYQFRPVKKVLRLNSDRVTYIVHTGHHWRLSSSDEESKEKHKSFSFLIRKCWKLNIFGGKISWSRDNIINFNILKLSTEIANYQTFQWKNIFRNAKGHPHWVQDRCFGIISFVPGSVSSGKLFNNWNIERERKRYCT